MNIISLLSIVFTIIFIIAPIWLMIVVIYRYNRMELTVANYTAMLRAVMTYLEGRQGPIPPLPESIQPKSIQPEPTEDKSRFQPFARFVAYFRSRILPEEWLNDLKLHEEYADYLDVIRHGTSERERFMRLKRKNLTMQKGVTEDVEFCRTYTEMLPYMGILGTVLGFFFSPAIFLPGATVGVTIGGLVVALSSTAAALICILVIKMAYENRIIPKAIEFEQSLQVIDDYARRYGELELVRES